MANILTAYGTAAQAVTVTLASLGSAAARESTAVDNSGNLFLDVLFTLRIKTGAGALSGDQVINIYVAGTVDPATPVWPDTVTGSDAAITLNSPTQLKLLGSIQVAATATTYTSEPLSIASAFGGVMPTKWSIVVENKAGAALDATEGNFKKLYQGVFATG